MGKRAVRRDSDTGGHAGHRQRPDGTLFGAGSAEPAANRSAIVEFIVDDVDAEYERLREQLTEVVTEPTTMPWGNRALLFRDPDGNLVNLFTPVTPEARAKFGI